MEESVAEEYSPAIEIDRSVLRQTCKDSRVLLVDDDEGVLSALEMLLETEGIFDEIQTASSAEAALELLEQGRFSLVVSDLKLPQMDGLQLTRHVRSYAPQTRALLLTAYGSDAIRSSAKDIGCGFLAKPFDAQAILAAIKGEQESAQPPALLDQLLSGLDSGESESVNIVADGEEGLIAIREGELVYAEYGFTNAEEAVRDILAAKKISTSPSDVYPLIPNTSFFREDLEAFYQAVISPLREGNRLHVTVERLTQEAPNVVVVEHKRDNESEFSLYRLRPEETEEINDTVSEEAMRLTPELVIDSEEDQQSFRQNLLRKGLEHFKERRFKAAEERWMLLLSIDPQCHAAHRNLAVLKRVRRGR